MAEDPQATGEEKLVPVGTTAPRDVYNDLEELDASLGAAPRDGDGSQASSGAKVGVTEEDAEKGKALDDNLSVENASLQKGALPVSVPVVHRRAPEEDATSPEILSIMEQFASNEEHERQNHTASAGENSVAALHPENLPPRRSSLQHLEGNQQTQRLSSQTDDRAVQQEKLPSSPSTVTESLPQATVPQRVSSLPRELPPAPDPEPDLPFDFHRFLEQLRHRTADPVARYLRSFLSEFAKRSWLVHEQVKFIQDFLLFISGRMSQCEIWKGVSQAEFDNAREGMEKLVMNRLYNQTFSPVIPPSSATTASRNRRKQAEKPPSGRRGQHQEDVERDDIVSQKIRIYSWVEERHLDISPVGSNGHRLLALAQQELSKINSYRAPRDKIICVLNCCKVIFGLLRNSKASDTSADSFMPLLIYVILHANPEHLISNVNFILRFRDQDKLGGETGYYVSSLMGAVQFVESLDRTALTVTDEEFERSAELAVSAIAERQRADAAASLEALPEQSTEKPQRAAGTMDTLETNNSEDEKHADGLLQSIQKPLASIGKMFSDEEGDTRPNHPPGESGSRTLSPNVFLPPHKDGNQLDANRGTRENLGDSRSSMVAALTASAVHQQATISVASGVPGQEPGHANIVETLANMFPGLDKDVIEDVVRLKQGRVGQAVDACLALST